MKNKVGLFGLLFMTMSLSLTASAASANILQEAQKLEAQMDQVKGDVATTSLASANQQFEIVKKATAFVHKALSQKKVDDPTIMAVSRIIIRDYFYDQAEDLAVENFQLIEKYFPRIDKAFNELERQGKFDRKTLEAVRVTIGIAGNVIENGTDSPPRKPNSVSKPKIKVMPKAQPESEVEEGAALTPCDFGHCNEQKKTLSHIVAN